MNILKGEKEKLCKIPLKLIIMSQIRNIFVIALLSHSSCNFGAKEVCNDIDISDLYRVDSISSGLPISGAINGVSMESWRKIFQLMGFIYRL